MASPFRVENGVVTYNGRPVSEISEEEKTRGFGSLGNIQFGWGTEYDPRFYDVTYSATDDSGNSVANYQLKPEFRRWENLIQVGIPRSVGGYSEVNDPSQIFWDDELGYVTNISNFRGPKDSGIGQWIVPMLALGMGAAIAATGGFAGLFGAAAGEGIAAGVGEGVAGGVSGGATTGVGGVIGSALEPIAASTIEAVNPALASIEGIGASTAQALGAGAPVTPTAGLGGGLGGGGLEVSEAMRGILSQGTAAGGSAASAAANAAITQGTQTLAGIGGGSAFGAVGDWFNSLSSGSQRLITSAIGQGVSAISASRRQQEAQQFAREQQDIAAQRRQEETERQRQFEREQEDIAEQRRREKEDREREERRIRGTPQAYTFNITPRNRTGIIGSGMGG